MMWIRMKITDMIEIMWIMIMMKKMKKWKKWTLAFLARRSRIRYIAIYTTGKLIAYFLKAYMENIIWKFKKNFLRCRYRSFVRDIHTRKKWTTPQQLHGNLGKYALLSTDLHAYKYSRYRMTAKTKMLVSSVAKIM